MHLPDETRLTFKLRQAHTKCYASLLNFRAMKKLVVEDLSEIFEKIYETIQEQVPLQL